MSELGQLLKEKREALNKTISAVSHDTKITEKLISIMEEGRFKDLPSYLHAFGFVKKYSEYLGYKYEEDIKSLFDIEYPKDPEIVLKSDVSIGLNEHKKQRSNNRLVFVVIILMAAAGGGYLALSSKSADTQEEVVVQEVPVAEEIPEVMVAKEDELVSLSEIIDVSNGDNASDNITDNSTNVAVETVTAEEAIEDEQEEDMLAFTNAQRNDVVLSFNEECWLQFTADNDTAIEFTANGGTVRTLSFQDKFKIYIGNAAALTITHEDQVIENIGAQGQVREIVYVLKDGELTPENN